MLVHERSAPVATPDVAAWSRQVDDLTRRLDPRFCRREHRERVRAHRQALLSPIDRKNGWQIAEHSGDVSPDQMQRFVRMAPWDEDAVRDDRRLDVGEHLGDPTGVRVVDETGFHWNGHRPPV